MNQDEIVKMCKHLARKYNDPQEYEDLVSEGVVRVLEMVADGKTDKNLLYSHAKREMHDYYNVRRSPVYVPVGGNSHSMSSDTEVDGWTATALQQALFGDSVEYEDYMLQVPSTEEIYEKKEWFAKVQTVAVTHLTQEEWAIIRMRYWDEMTQDEVGKEMCRNKMWVSRHEKAALEKIRNNL